MLDARGEGAPRLVHADVHLLVWDKPSGLHSVPAKPPATQDCLMARAELAYPGALLVHRLDRDTSGLVVMARTRLAQRHLGWQFERRQVEKTYVARVAGTLTGEGGEVDLPLRVDWPNRPRQMVAEDGKPSRTLWRVLDRESGDGGESGGGGATRVELTPLTGRSHQLRVHMLSLGHPILGDTLYGDPSADATARLQLHAARLAFRHPDGGAMVEFHSAPPF
ncbi:MAG: RluA family pseudouridine synthase [Amaricoccus sp.]|uniref:RluA family pseudouridine synthase n=1 Tax=Amaricoccus sp. TaxID=1872485 RepID=UPI0039E61166